MSKKNVQAVRGSLQNQPAGRGFYAENQLMLPENLIAESTEYGSKIFTEGIKKGRAAEKKDISINLAIMGLDIELIAQAVGVNVETAQSWLEFYKIYD